MSIHKDSVDSVDLLARFLRVDKDQSDFGTIIACVFIITHQFQSKIECCVFVCACLRHQHTRTHTHARSWETLFLTIASGNSDNAWVNNRWSV